MLTVDSMSGVSIRLTDVRWRHIVARHPEMAEELGRIAETLRDPDMLQEGDYGATLAVRSFPKTSLSKKYVIVVFRETDRQNGFVITAYLTSRPAEWRRVRWKR